MTAPAYTTCFNYAPPDKPFNKTRDMMPMFLKNGAMGAFFGLLTGLASGFLIGGPFGAIVGALLGSFAAGYAAVATSIKQGADNWLHHRLVCLTGRVCALGQIRTAPGEGELGEFDNDEFFDLRLMPHPHTTPYDVTADEKLPETKHAQAGLNSHPANRVFDDGFLGQELLRPRDDLLTDLGYCSSATKDEESTKDRSKVARNWLHVEAEGDFWVRMDDLSGALGLLAGVETAAVVGGGIAGGYVGCLVGLIFGPIGCLIGAVIGAILGAGAVAGAAALTTIAVLQGIFDTNPGDLEDANVGDKPLGRLFAGDVVAVFGVHVYDGFHAGWHEMHPLLKIVKIGTAEQAASNSLNYLTWNPDFRDDGKPPHMALPQAQLADLTAEDMRQGLSSELFRKWCVAVRKHWCDRLAEAGDGALINIQARPEHRWAVHPAVDGCLPVEPSPGHLPPDPGPH